MTTPSSDPLPGAADARPAAQPAAQDGAAPRARPDLVAARLRYVERQARLDPTAFDVAFEGRAPGGSGPANRHGRPQLPPGQRVVQNWPVLDLGERPDIAREAWRLEVTGRVAAPVTLDLEALLALPQSSVELDFHCVTTWSRMGLHVRGVRLRDLLAEVAPLDDAAFVLQTGYDHQPGTDVPYTTSVPLARAAEEDVMIVHEVDGAPLAREHGGPVRLIVPRLYAWKGAKWLRRIELAVEDRPGFWETRGYSNSAEPWFNDRYSSDT